MASEQDLERRLEELHRLAVRHCRAGSRDEALAAVEGLLAAGFPDLRGLMEDKDLAILREDERFRSMIRKVSIERYIAMLEREERAAFQKPDQVMAALAFRGGERVADIGAGSSYFTIPIARAVGPAGKVWALDIRQELLDYARRKIEAAGVTNVVLDLVPADDPQLRAESVDTILMVDTIHYIADRTAYARKLRRAIAPGGRVVIIDYIPRPWSERPFGPAPEQQIPRATIDRELAAAGLEPRRVHDFLPEQYFVEYGAS